MSLINKITGYYFNRRLKKISSFENNPFKTQESVFRFLTDYAQKTKWGKNYNYQNIKSCPDFEKALEIFKETVPISSYDDLKIWIDEARSGQKNILWPGKTKLFSKSSGTTSDKSKFIPVTIRSLKKCHFAAGQDAFAMYFAQNPESKILAGKILGLVGSKQEDPLNKNNYCGDISAIILDKLAYWIQLKRAPKKHISLMSEWETKLTAIINDVKDKDIRALAGAPSWMLVLLNKIEQETGKKIPELWPNLEVLFYGGMSITPYLWQYTKICGPNLKYIETYGASEGLFGVNADAQKNDLLLMLDYEIFYEFLPLEELEKEKPKTHSLAEVELNKNYALVISTSGGLWRYLIGDTIKFTNLNPYRFIISGRTKSFINVFGEELMIDNTNQAISLSCQETGALFKEYSAAPIFMNESGQGAHEWLIEFEKEPTDLKLFTKILDQNLQKLNSDYEAKRYKDITLKELKLTVARPNLFLDWLKSKNKLGGQHKVPRLFNDRQIFEEMLSLNKKTG